MPVSLSVKSDDDWIYIRALLGFPGGSADKEPACQCRRYKRCRFSPPVGKIPWRRKRQPTPVFFHGEFHGQRILASYSPWGCKESDMTEHALTHTHTRALGEGKGNPLQYSFMENSMDRRSWQVTVHGVAKSRTWLSMHLHTHTQEPYYKNWMNNA